MKKKSNTPKLPDVPSKLLSVAIKDLEKIEKLPKKYKVNMGTFHDAPQHTLSGKCEVCFAGSVMARTLKTPMGEDCFPEAFDKATQQKLWALDAARSGDISSFLETMDFEQDPEFKLAFNEVEVPEYSVSKAGFKRAIKKMISILKRAGI